MPRTVLIDRLTQVKYTYEDLGEGLTSIFKEPRKHSLGSPHKKRECAASLNARKHASEKKI